MLGLLSHLYTLLSSFVETHGLKFMLHCEIKHGAVKHVQWCQQNNKETLLLQVQEKDPISRVLPVLESGHYTNLIGWE